MKATKNCETNFVEMKFHQQKKILFVSFQPFHHPSVSRFSCFFRALNIQTFRKLHENKAGTLSLSNVSLNRLNKGVRSREPSRVFNIKANTFTIEFHSAFSSITSAWNSIMCGCEFQNRVCLICNFKSCGAHIKSKVRIELKIVESTGDIQC